MFFERFDLTEVKNGSWLSENPQIILQQNSRIKGIKCLPLE
jgi:hypothetical protein